MASQTVSNLTDILKEVWTADRLHKQFYDEAPWLDRLEKTDRYTIGKQAQVPIHKERSGADTTLSSAGGSLNPADPQDVEQAAYTLAYNWRQISIEFGALNQAAGGAASVVESKDLEVTGAIADMRKSVLRQALSNGDALIAQCTTSSATNTINLLATGYGNDAIVRGWLRPGQTIDIGTTASEATIAGDISISSVVESTSAPQIVVSGSAITTSSSHYVSIANARTGTTSKEMLGLRSLAGSTSTVVGGLDPSTETYWKPSSVDSTSTVMSIDVPLALQQAVFQKTGKFPTFALTSIKQITNLYRELQSQVRFQNDMVRAGNVLSVEWNGMKIEAQPDVPDREFYMLTPEDLLLVTGKYSKPVWASDVQGANTGAIWSAGATNFVDGLVYAVGLGARRRNTHASATALTA